MRPVIEKELLHYDILFSVDNAGLLDHLTFQGGTSLRLSYGSPRFSEDLYFAGGIDFKTQDLIIMKSCIEKFLGKKYGLEVMLNNSNKIIISYRMVTWINLSWLKLWTKLSLINWLLL